MHSPHICGFTVKAGVWLGAIENGDQCRPLGPCGFRTDLLLGMDG